LGESQPVIGKTANPQSGQPSKNPVKKDNERLGDDAAKPSGGNGKLRDQPLGVPAGMSSQSHGKRSYFFGRQAIEEEMRDDQVIIVTHWLEKAGIGKVGHQALLVCTCPMAKLVQHRAAGIHRIDSDAPIFIEQTRCESAVTISEDKRRAAALQRFEKSATQHERNGPKLNHSIQR
jgi:hypothetical protein